LKKRFTSSSARASSREKSRPNHDARALARFLFNAMSGLRVAAKAGAGPSVYEDVVNLSLSVLRSDG
jgi:hypothetical protein